MSNTKLDPEFKAKWIAALRSGEYSQGRFRLFKGDDYCCLGVGCVVAGIYPKTLDENNDEYIKTRHADAFPVLSPLIHIEGNRERPSAVLAKMNDSQNKTFLQIADFIEANY